MLTERGLPMSHPTLDDYLDRRDAIDPDRDSDEVIAAIIADCLLWSKPPYYLSILHDVRVRRDRSEERMRRITPYIPPYPIGPCSLPYDWKYKNTVGIDTRDRVRARQWIIDAMLAGYGVCHIYSPKGRGGGSGYGPLAEIRESTRNWLSPRGQQVPI